MLMVPDHLVDDEPQELLAKVRIELSIRRQRAQPGDLAVFARRVGSGQGMFRLVGADRLGDAEAFRQHVDQRGVDIVDAGAEAGQNGIGRGRSVGHRALR